eukprot:CAMPEP_0115715244 /NCGR_PEP_ID=MMETSP0272-20121206/75683_1 /TAXON_ID=71861 /ORGANISM="Scrippsiella trochoidea, Strain CCMP3099" /LENGTH=155 /DNA_ID=CAMNT_0003157471 /DNA_START=118 /DNA_END=586 /DNA_ORIENTATION=+
MKSSRKLQPGTWCKEASKLDLRLSVHLAHMSALRVVQVHIDTKIRVPRRTVKEWVNMKDVYKDCDDGPLQHLDNCEGACRQVSVYPPAQREQVEKLTCYGRVALQRLTEAAVRMALWEDADIVGATYRPRAMAASMMPAAANGCDLRRAAQGIET